jgi:2-polyprenyl-6-methoxyphenol hydroxylase-like FAD-dependent oxidoreductase
VHRAMPPMSPIGGVGVNFAIQDAVAAANVMP